ncbi:LAGLIDADG family homing endonuclease [Thioalkalivibrio sulfidiphilus]|uniref:Ribonucleoside-diphosphate reductase n=1 Tax=Thioalkalivibrio sulfidiphilus (strain HL-EbGR7) TaxID=396588 RepID=B8GMT3_THISH|nr:LAGLIDADG family homing endonuclease [Thioalkalivibrio sulfidiphilus]ACL73748.1 Ribonucleoside-diphosphate reductase [Thioalkalivibrio sulfidiphilus HL-EbGr7]
MSQTGDPGNGPPSLPLQPAARDVWDRKYRLRDATGRPLEDTPAETLARVARALADVEATPALREHWRERFLWALNHGALPAGRILANAGARDHKRGTSTINCTVSGTIHDTLDEILGKLREAGLTLQSGAGIGYEFSTLRPKGAWVAGAGARSSGPLSFMDVYDQMCRTIASAGDRRGAQMATFHIGHPDVLEFIEAKREPGRLRQFNLSLLVPDAFMAALDAGADWPLAFPLSPAEQARTGADLQDPKQVVWRHWPETEGYITDGHGRVACRVQQWIPAAALWEQVMRATYDHAEPGVIFIDRVNAENNNGFCESIRAANPCVTADTWVQTDQGPRQVRTLVDRAFNARLDGNDHPSGSEGFFFTGVRPVVIVRTGEGHALRLTEDHRVRRVIRFTRHTQETDWCSAGELHPGDLIQLNDHRANAQWHGNFTASQGYLLGLLVGDGTLKSDAAVLSVWAGSSKADDAGDGTISSGVKAIMRKAEQAVRGQKHRSDFAGWSKVAGRGEYRLKCVALRDLAFEVGMRPGNKPITPAIECGSSEFCRSFLRGFYDADGSVQGSQIKGVSVRLAQSDIARLEAVQRMLLRLGIASKLYRNRRIERECYLPDGKGGEKAYTTRAQHELIISGENILRFAEFVGFGDTDKQASLERLIQAYRRRPNRERFVARVASVTVDGEEPVYDVRIPGINAFDANGFHTHNCGEQMLPPYGACLLGSVDLTRFVQHPFTGKLRFDWDTYREVVAVFTRMLDNVVEIHGLPLAQQAEALERTRRHGMGFLGLGSALAMMGIRYDSPEAAAFTERAARELALTGWRTGLELAREKGPAPLMYERFTVTEHLLARYPALAEDGIRVGDVLPGRVLHARYSPYMRRIAGLDPALVAALAEEGARFTHHSAIAPTGTIALSFGNNVSNGIEPSFAHTYLRNILGRDGATRDTVPVTAYELLAWRALVDPDADPEAKQGPHRLPEAFVTAGDIAPRAHLAIQAAAQPWIDAAISKTINVPTDCPFEDFRDLYREAHALGLKGCTTYRLNPAAFQGVLLRPEDLAHSRYRFILRDGRCLSLAGDRWVRYGEHRELAANLYGQLRERGIRETGGELPALSPECIDPPGDPLEINVLVVEVACETPHGVSPVCPVCE